MEKGDLEELFKAQSQMGGLQTTILSRKWFTASFAKRIEDRVRGLQKEDPERLAAISRIVKDHFPSGSLRRRPPRKYYDKASCAQQT